MSELQAELPDTRRDLFDLHDMFAGPRPFAFVGNAGSILDYDNGALIDSHDVVVRFNRTTTAGIEHKVGSRMDILCANLSNALEKAPLPGHRVAPARCRAIRHQRPQGPRGRPSTGFPGLGGQNTAGDHLRTRSHRLPSWCPYPSAHPRHLCTLRVSAAISDRAAVSHRLHHVRTGRPHTAQELRGTAASSLDHDLDTEAKIFCEIVRRFPGSVVATPEVEQLLARHGSDRIKRRPNRGIHTRSQEWAAWHLQRPGFKLRRHLEQKGTRLPLRAPD